MSKNIVVSTEHEHAPYAQYSPPIILLYAYLLIQAFHNCRGRFFIRTTASKDTRNEFGTTYSIVAIILAKGEACSIAVYCQIFFANRI